MRSRKSTAVFSAMMLATLFAASALAGLGETPGQCRQRYGEAVSRAQAPPDLAGLYSKMRLYSLPSYYVRAEFLDGKAVMIAYRHKKNQPLADREIAEILADHANGAEWEQQPETPARQHWQTRDGSRHAIYSSVNNLLVIKSRDDARRRERYRQERRERYQQDERPE